jgi:hypothetical protein
MATPAIQLRERDPIHPEHLVTLLENAVLTLEQRQQRAIDRAKFAESLGAHVGRARALEAAETYAECRRLILAVLDG